MTALSVGVPAWWANDLQVTLAGSVLAMIICWQTPVDERLPRRS